MAFPFRTPHSELRISAESAIRNPQSAIDAIQHSLAFRVPRSALRASAESAIRNPQSAIAVRRPTGRDSTELVEVSPWALIAPSPPHPLTPSLAKRSGFTLIELLVVVSILAVLMTITFTAFTRTNDAERVRSASRQIQSYVEGARDRAIHAREPRGVRFLLDPNAGVPGVPDTVSSMVFIGAPGTYSTGTIQVLATRSVTADPSWNTLVDRGLINRQGARILLEAGLYYTVAVTGNAAPYTFTLTKDYTGTIGTDIPYVLDLEPAVLPNQEPRLIARNIVIDLDKSVLPPGWTANRMDVMFSPRGTVIGDVAARGLVHFFIADSRDVLQGRSGKVDTPGAAYVDLDSSVDLGSVTTLENTEDLAYRVLLVDDTRVNWITRNFVSIQSGPPWRINFSPVLPVGFVPALARVEPIPEDKRGDERIVTLTPQTGNISTHEVNPGGNPFLYAHLGALAK
ncbi:MAG: prepilin-type N-terminal cleavage/methylation domain-containing protein [Planctomycetaceae bacterium]